MSTTDHQFPSSHHDEGCTKCGGFDGEPCEPPQQECEHEKVCGHCNRCIKCCVGETDNYLPQDQVEKLKNVARRFGNDEALARLSKEKEEKPTPTIKAIEGEKIKSAKIVCHLNKGCDGENLLVLEMESGKTFYVEGGYGGYTGDSCGEYYEYVDVKTSHNFDEL